MGSPNHSILAVFDCDGTLVDSQHSIIQAMQMTSFTYGMEPVGREAVRRIVGLPLEKAMEILFSNQGRDDFDMMAETYRLHFRTLRQRKEVREPLYEGVLETLNLLRQDKFFLGVATGKAMRGLQATLATHDMKSFFDTLQTPDTAQGKPHPEMLFNAMDETGSHANETIMIGDTTYDILMACNANVKSIGVTWGYHEERELKNAGANIIVHRFDQIPDAINKLMET